MSMSSFPALTMRKMCPNFNRENAPETVLEVPNPEKMFVSMGSNANHRWQNLHTRMMRAQDFPDDNNNNSSTSSSNSNNNSHLTSGTSNEFMALLKFVGSPLIPFQVPPGHSLTRSIKESSMIPWCRVIIRSFDGKIHSPGGVTALDSVNSMYAVGQVEIVGSEMRQGDGSMYVKENGEIGGFLLWEKNPGLWYLELVVSGFKVSAGSDGKVAWNQSSSQPSRGNKGPPRPLHRFFQGIDPRTTANLFIDAVCIGEKKIEGEPCFVLKIEAASSILKSRSSPNTELVHHTWGYFSQKTGLLIKFEDTKLVRMKVGRAGNHSAFWEMMMESRDYRHVEGLNIAHGGKTCVTLHRHRTAQNHKRRIEETDFNFWGLSMDCFLPPADLKREQEGRRRRAGDRMASELRMWSLLVFERKRKDS